MADTLNLAFDLAKIIQDEITSHPALAENVESVTLKNPAPIIIPAAIKLKGGVELDMTLTLGVKGPG